MHSLLIVDDEVEIVQYLCDLFRERGPDDLDIYRAYCAREAMQWLNRTKIDVVLSDIKMPGIDGLQLLARIRANWPACKVVFLTGYREFDSVYQAIQHPGVRYLVKTANDDTILESVRLAIEELEHSLKLESLIGQVERQLSRNGELLQREYLLQLLGVNSGGAAADQGQLDALNLPLRAELPAMLLLGRFDGMAPDESPAAREKRQCAMRLIAGQFMPGAFRCAFVAADAYMAWIIQPPAADGEGEDGWRKAAVLLTGSVELMQASCRKTADATVSFALYTEPFPLARLQEKFACLRQLFHFRIFRQTEMLLTEKNLLDETPACAFDGGALQALPAAELLKSSLEQGRRDEFFRLFSQYAAYLSGANGMDQCPALQAYYTVALLIMGYVNRWSLVDRISLSGGLERLAAAGAHESGHDAALYLAGLCDALFDMQREKQENREAGALDKVRRYIHAHLEEDLSLARIAEAVYFNPSYLSRLFKRMTGGNISDYILELRVEKAKELIRAGKYRMHEIASKVGYESPHTFTRCFRKAMNMTPQEFLDSLR